MRLRNLKIKDAPLMLEWMHDEEIVGQLHSNFKEKTVNDCINFINHSLNDKESVHKAIVSENDEYLGTVSLKNIDRKNKTAEFAIVIRKKVMGKSYSWFGMREILKIGFEKEKLSRIYWCVSRENKRACKFYDKHNFREYNELDSSILESYKGTENLKWYFIDSESFADFYNNGASELAKIIKIRTVQTEKSGQLSFVENIKDIPFEIKRIYYLTKVGEGFKRGFHAHKNLKQLLFCPYGKINIILDDGLKKEEVLLDDPSKGILIEKPLWREMAWIESNSVLMVLASDYYSEDDYIRDYNAFLSFQKSGK